MTAIVRTGTSISTPSPLTAFQLRFLPDSTGMTGVLSRTFLLDAPAGSRLSLLASLTNVAKESALIFRIMCPV